MKYSILFLLFLAFFPTASAVGEDYRKECQTYRQINAGRDSASVQSYIAKVNRQRALYQVDNLELSNRQQRNHLLFFIIMGSIAILAATTAALFHIRKENNRLRLSKVRLNEARRAADNSMRMKSLFLSNMSHEIRTPLNALSGFSSILTEPNIDAEIRQQCNDVIQQNSDLLLKLIDDVVDLSSLESGKMHFRFGRHEVVKSCCNVVETVEKIKQTAAVVRFETELPELTLYTDKARLQQLLINLLVNATKFTTEGSITLKLSVAEGEEMALFTVTDTGCGIAPEKRGTIFNRFEKLDENASGSGLGLSICQLIIERFGGRIWIDPDYTGGTRFCFTHPMNSDCVERKEEEA